MHVDSACCAGCASSGKGLQGLSSLHGLGFWEALAAGAVSYFTKDTKGGSPAAGGGGMMPSSITANTNTVSPQISPVFVQQDNPTNSPVNASPVQAQPNAVPNAYGAYPTSSLSPVYGAPQAGGLDQNLLMLGGLGVLGAAVLLMNKPKSKKTKRGK